MIYGYIRVSTDRQTVENQRFEINEFCKKSNIFVGKWIEETISGMKEVEKRKLGGLLESLQRSISANEVGRHTCWATCRSKKHCRKTHR